MFVAGNLIIIVAAVVYELAELVLRRENRADRGRRRQHPAGERRGDVRLDADCVIVGLLVDDVFSAVSLSAIYRSPLDIKSAHLIRPGTRGTYA